jgi:AcrR family transcriptional regulator
MGYEQMSVQDVLDELNASRGAFYHYFDSKVALLAAVVERMVEDGLAGVQPVLADPNLSAVEKLSCLFSGVARYKGAQEDLVLGITRVWFSDANVLVRDRLRQATAAHLTPVLAAIVRQGRAEGAFTAGSPNDTASVLVALWQGLNEVANQLWVARQSNTVTLQAIERTVSAYLEAFERILGMPAGSLPFDRRTLHEWFG